MFEQFTNQAMAILSLTIGGVSVSTIIGLAIYLIKAIVKNRKEINTTKEQIETAFKSVVLPKNIKLDVSNKIQEPIRAGLATIQLYLTESLARVAEGEKLILSILSKFSHVDKLTEEEQEAIKEFLDEGKTVEEQL